MLRADDVAASHSGNGGAFSAKNLACSESSENFQLIATKDVWWFGFSVLRNARLHLYRTVTVLHCMQHA